MRFRRKMTKSRSEASSFNKFKQKAAPRANSRRGQHGFDPGERTGRSLTVDESPQVDGLRIEQETVIRKRPRLIYLLSSSQSETLVILQRCQDADFVFI